MTMKQTIIEMIESCTGGKSAVAGFLGLTESELNNRLYQSKKQRFKDEELIAIEQEFGVSHWSDEVNRQLGKVAFRVPNADELDTAELSELQLHELAKRGLLFAELEKALADGEVTQAEADVLGKLLNRSQCATAKVITATIELYRKR
ncbi:YmfL family putative regulatory protein [Mannheimia indoligenes]|uniref:YmfL family putative regulatory protein n=1 Tax=Mannheimia indoligenes TaxID=3103145 RepID=UPI002FE66F15